MCLFFALSRDNEKLRKELEFCFDEEHIFDWQRGEFCAFLAEPSNHRLVFGRDVFGRKSLCWRIVPSLTKEIDEGGGGIFQLSVFPGLYNENDTEWHEVPPGCIVVLNLPPSSKVEAVINSKLLCNSLFDLTCQFGSSLDQFLRQTCTVHTYYPHDQFSENSLFTQFGATRLIAAKGAKDILLPPVEIAPTVSHVDAAQIAKFTSEFVRRFAAALEGILFSVPCIVDRSEPDWAGMEIPVLFSGGVDSLMVALTAGEVLMGRVNGREKSFARRILLFSVAFADQQQQQNYLEASDRTQSIAAYDYLKSRSLKKYGINPFSLILINVTRQELVDCRQRHIAKAVAPSKTVLDDSIGCVVWFASRMQGIEYESGEEILDSTPFALVGSGSDEQLGGYARHRTVFESKGLAGLTKELSMEMHRIGARNFGRDDRVGTSNGKAILAPYLEEDFVRWLNTLPSMVKTGFGLVPTLGAPNKFLLRNALRSLGVPEQCVQRPKRAMQFGTRMTKMEMRQGKAKQKGCQICEKLSAIGGGLTQ